MLFSLWRSGNVPMVVLKVLLTMLPMIELATINVIEYFSGVATIVEAANNRGLVAHPFDADHGPSHDILGGLGYLRALALAISIVPGGLAMLAPVCSTWIKMAMGHTLRSRAFPHGKVGGGRNLGRNRSDVLNANIMIWRVSILLRIFYALGVMYFLEQPEHSFLILHEAMQILLREGFDVFRVRFNMEIFGAPTRKPTWVYSSHAVVGSLVRHCDPALALPVKRVKPKVNTTFAWRNASGRKRFAGTPELKGTQAYPKAFGDAVCTCYRSNIGLVAHGLKPFMEPADHTLVEQFLQQLRSFSGDDCRGASLDSVRAAASGS